MRPKLTPDVQKRICEGIELGLTHALAAQYGGVNRSSLYDWLAKGEAETKGRHRTFSDAFRAAESRGAARCMATILKASQAGTWQAAAWIMERRHGYVARQDIRQEVSGPDGGPVETAHHIDLSACSIEQLDAIRDAARAKIAAEGESE